MESLKHFLSYAQTHQSLLEKIVSQGLKDVSEIQWKSDPRRGQIALFFLPLFFFFQYSHLVSYLEFFTLYISLSPLAVCFSLFLTLSYSSLQVVVSSVPFLRFFCSSSLIFSWLIIETTLRIAAWEKIWKLMHTKVLVGSEGEKNGEGKNRGGKGREVQWGLEEDGELFFCHIQPDDSMILCEMFSEFQQKICVSYLWNP